MSGIEEEKNNSTEIIDIHSEQLGKYSQEQLIDRKILAKIQKYNFSINSHSEFNVPALEKDKILFKKIPYVLWNKYQRKGIRIQHYYQ